MPAAAAQNDRARNEVTMSMTDHPLQLILLLSALSLLPLFVVMGTSFLKISIVLSTLRNALGIHQIPRGDRRPPGWWRGWAWQRGTGRWPA